MLDLAIAGALAGAMYGLAALGLTLVWGTLKVVNIAHGTLMLLAAYVTLTLFTGWRLDPVVALVVTLPALFLLGMGLYRAVVARVMDRPDAEMASLLVLFGVMVIIENMISFYWTANVRDLTTGYAGVAWMPLPGVRVPVPQLISASLVVAATAALYAFLQYTFLGRAIRAVTQNDRMAKLCGVDTGGVATFTFGLGSALSSVAGAALVLLYPIYPTVHILWVLKAFLVAVLGGLTSVMGTFAVGVALGIVEAVLSALMPFRWVNVALYALLLIVLLGRGGGASPVRLPWAVAWRRQT